LFSRISMRGVSVPATAAVAETKAITKPEIRISLFMTSFFPYLKGSVKNGALGPSMPELQLA
jgi:hypothetical protein